MRQVYLSWADCQSGENTIVAKAVSQEQFKTDVKAAVAMEEKTFLGCEDDPNAISDLLITKFGYEKVPVIGCNLAEEYPE